MDLTLPVSPYVGTIDNVKDVVFSLLSVAPAARIRYKRPKETLSYKQAEINSGRLSVQAMADLGISTGVSVSLHGETNIACYTVNLTGYADVHNTISDSLITSGRFAVGFRMGVVAFNWKSDAQVSTPALLAASATLNLASSLYQVMVLGAGVEALPILKPLLIASAGEFNTDTYAVLGAAEDQLEAYITEHKATLTPALESVTVDATALIEELYPKGTGDYRQDILAQTYAFERAYHEQSCDEALADPRVADHHLNQEIITDVYLSILNVPDTTTKPDDAARAMCADILRCGRW
jgi:hypothetical protein